jgi:hypothetical protein
LGLFDSGDSGWWDSTRVIARDFLKLPTDELPFHNSDRRKWVKERFYALPWHGAYDFAEFIAQAYPRMQQANRWGSKPIETAFDRVFTAENSGYRFVGGELVPISSTAEVQAVDEALQVSRRQGLAGAHAHLEAAIKLLAKRPDPDYRNSIKESISAVESMAKQVSGSDAQGLAGALDELARSVPLHGALRSAFTKLYGYTSDESGIRHAILEEPSVGYDEAKYMLVVCSAFVHYLASKLPPVSSTPSA